MEGTDRGLNIDLSQTEPILCDDCGHDTFQQVFFMRKVSAVIAGEQSVLPISTFECSRCGHVNDMFVPKSNL